MTEPHSIVPPHANRRSLLKGLGATALSAAVAGGARPTLADELPTEGATQAMVGAAPPVAPLEVIALNRMGFGLRPGDIQAFRALGDTPEAQLEAYVEQQLHPEAITDEDCDTRMAAEEFISLHKSLAQLWAEHVRSDEGWRHRMAPIWETERATFLRAVYSRRQLQEVLADFWHNHFNVFGWDYWIGPVFVHYDRDVIRANIFGNFRRMLGLVATSTAMLYYLDNRSNSGGNPNENYARELFELHTLGAENYLGVRAQTEVPKDSQGRPVGYVDEDVYGATTCFTGWTVNEDTGLFLYDAAMHFPYQKFVLGQIIDSNQAPLKDGNDVLDMLASYPGTGRHIARKLCRRLIGDNPPERIVQEAAAVFTDNWRAADQLQRVVRAILLSPEFRTTWGEKMKRPFEVAVSALRAVRADFAPGDNFFWWYNNNGQPLFQWPPPNGYPDTRDAWSGSVPMLQRWRLCNWMMEGQEGIAINVNRQTSSSLRTPNQLATFWTRRILGRDMAPNDYGQIVDFMAQGRNPDQALPSDQIEERLRYMVGLILLSPDFQWR